MSKQQLEYINKTFGQIVDQAPVAIVYYDTSDGQIIKYSKKAEETVLAATGLDEMPTTVFGDLSKLSPLADRMRDDEEFEFYVVYDHKQHRFIPLTHLSGADYNKVLVVRNFKAVDKDGNYISGGIVLRHLADSKKELLFSDSESDKYAMLTKAFGMTELEFNPFEMTMDVHGGRDRYNLQGAPIENVSKLIHPEDADFFVDQFADAAVQRPENMHFTVRVYSIKLKMYRYFKIVFYPRIDSMGNILSYGGFCFDITEEELALRNKLKDLKSMIDESNVGEKDDREIISALANISHDLRNPIGIITGMSDMMVETESRELREKYNHAIQESARRMLNMVKEILTLNRLESGAVEVNYKTFDLEAMLLNTSDVYSLQFRNHKLTLDFERKGAPLLVNSDEGYLIEILDNYLSNALKYTAKGGVTLRYDINDNDVCIHVIDTGKGISEEDCAKVFDRFEKLNTTIKGNGLGLHIVKGLAQAMGGNVGVKSELGKGSDFWVSIPKLPAVS